MRGCLGNNRPDQGQLLAAAGSWRTDETQREPEMRIGVRGAIRCFSAPQPRSASLLRVHSLPLQLLAAARSASCCVQQAVRSGLLRGRVVCLFPRTCRCVVLAVRRVKGGDGGSDHGLRVRLLEATDIATMDDKMLMEEAPSNAGWTSTGFMHTYTLDKFLPRYGSTDRCSSAPSS